MSTISKANRTANPKLTRNGRPRLKPLNLAQVKELLEKTSRPRDRLKISNRLKVLQKRLKKQGVLDLVESTTNDQELV